MAAKLRFQILLPFTVLAICLVPVAALGEILFQDDFESGSFASGWYSTEPTLQVTSDNPHTGTFSAKATYDVVERNNKIEIHQPWNEFYLRFYVYYGPGFKHGDQYGSWKFVRIGHWEPNSWWFCSLEWKHLGALQIHNVSSVDITKPADYLYYTPANEEWTCWEFYFKVNTPGVNDGIVEGWVNGVKRFSKTNMVIRDTLTTPVQYIWIIGNYSDHRLGDVGTPLPGGPFYVWLDNVVFSTEYIGPLAENPSDPIPTATPDTTPPTAEIRVID